jgi:hypothetical protein
MPTFSRAGGKPLYDVSGRRFEDRTRFQRRLDNEDYEEARGGTRVRPQNRLGAKKFGIEIVLYIAGKPAIGGDPKRPWRRYYRTAKARDQGLDHYNRRENLTAQTLGWDHRWEARSIEETP